MASRNGWRPSAQYANPNAQLPGTTDIEKVTRVASYVEVGERSWHVAAYLFPIGR